MNICCNVHHQFHYGCDWAGGRADEEAAAGGCGALGDNLETAGYMGRCGKAGGGPSEGCSVNVEDIPLPPRDIGNRWGTCAVVGHAAGGLPPGRLQLLLRNSRTSAIT
jgi:hypothetical protein